MAPTPPWNPHWGEGRDTMGQSRLSLLSQRSLSYWEQDNPCSVPLPQWGTSRGDVPGAMGLERWHSHHHIHSATQATTGAKKSGIWLACPLRCWESSEMECDMVRVTPKVVIIDQAGVEPLLFLACLPLLELLGKAFQSDPLPNWEKGEAWKDGSCTVPVLSTDSACFIQPGLVPPDKRVLILGGTSFINVHFEELRANWFLFCFF